MLGGLLRRLGRVPQVVVDELPDGFVVPLELGERVPDAVSSRPRRVCGVGADGTGGIHIGRGDHDSAGHSLNGADD